MSHPLEVIPVLTDIVADGPDVGAPIDRTLLFLGDLEGRLTTAIHDHADELVHNACRELEALLRQKEELDREQATLRLVMLRSEHGEPSGDLCEGKAWAHLVNAQQDRLDLDVERGRVGVGYGATIRHADAKTAILRKHRAPLVIGVQRAALGDWLRGMVDAIG
jgi:hypothetical protein